MKRLAAGMFALALLAGCCSPEKTGGASGDRSDIVSAVTEGAAKDCGCKVCDGRGCDPCHGKSCYYCVAKALVKADCGCKDCAAKGCAGCGPGCDVCKFHLKPAEDAKERGSSPK